MFDQFHKDASALAPEMTRWWLMQDAETQRKSLSTLFVEAMASCTAITYVNDELVGDPLDVKMFQSTGWILDESDQLRQAVEDNSLVLAYVYPNSAKHDNQPDLGSVSSNDDLTKRTYRSALIRRFDFSSGLQRMSVICKN